MVRVWQTKSLLFCLRYEPLIVFRRQNHITFISIKTSSHDLLVQTAYWQCFGDHFLWFCCKFNKKIFFYQPVNTERPKLFLSWYFLAQLILLALFIFRNCRETRSHFESRPKTVNIQGYSELREPIRMRKNCYPLIYWTLMQDIPRLSSQWEGVKNSIHCFSIY